MPIMEDPETERLLFNLGQMHCRFVKMAGEPVKTYCLAGRLVLSKSGWLLLTVSNAFGRGVFQSLAEPGTELPKGEKYNAHISVMSPDEVDEIGGPDAITERGKQFHYTTGPIKEVVPKDWDGVGKVWYVTVDSPELRALRKSYGLEPLRKGYDHHVTVAIRRTNVLRNNEVSKVAALPKPPVFLTKYAETVTALRAAGKETNTSPTEAQKETGNYKKGRLAWKGLTIAIENPKGSIRSGTAPDGKTWETVMKDHYGYVSGSVSGADEDAIDVFISEAHPESEVVFVINQNDTDGKFDEHKCILGEITEEGARTAYLRNYSKGWKGLGSIKSMTLDRFKEWVKSEPSKAAAMISIQEVREEAAEKRYLSRYKCPHCGGTNAFNGTPGTGTTFRGSGHCTDCDKGFSIVGSGMKPVGKGPEIVPTADQLERRRKWNEWEKKHGHKTAADTEKQAVEFAPDLTPAQLAAKGIHKPNPASWSSAPLQPGSRASFLDWYAKYTLGQRHDDDAKQIARWKALRAGHGGAYAKSPTPQRASVLENWGIDPQKILSMPKPPPTAEEVKLAFVLSAMEENPQEFVKVAQDDSTAVVLHEPSGNTYYFPIEKSAGGLLDLAKPLVKGVIGGGAALGTGIASGVKSLGSGTASLAKGTVNLAKPVVAPVAQAAVAAPRLAVPAVKAVGQEANMFGKSLAGYGPGGSLTGQKLLDSTTVKPFLPRQEMFSRVAAGESEEALRAASNVPNRVVGNIPGANKVLGAVNAANRNPILHPFVQTGLTGYKALTTPLSSPVFSRVGNALTDASKTMTNPIARGATVAGGRVAQGLDYAGRGVGMATTAGTAAALGAGAYDQVVNGPSAKAQNALRQVGGASNRDIQNNPEVARLEQEPLKFWKDYLTDDSELGQAFRASSRAALPQTLRNQAHFAIHGPIRLDENGNRMGPDFETRVRGLLSRLTLGGNAVRETQAAIADPIRPDVPKLFADEIQKRQPGLIRNWQKNLDSPTGQMITNLFDPHFGKTDYEALQQRPGASLSDPAFRQVRGRVPMKYWPYIDKAAPALQDTVRSVGHLRDFLKQPLRADPQYAARGAINAAPVNELQKELADMGGE